MKFMVLSALGAVALSGCTGGGCDTGDSACKGGGGGGGGTNSGTPLIMDVAIDCAGGECAYTIVGDADIGTVEVFLVETGDPSYEADCAQEGSAPAGDIVCGVWSEAHDLFTIYDDDNDGNGGDTKVLSLDIVGDYTQVVQNQTTIFDFDSGSISTQTTVLWVISDSSGNYADCATYGDRPEYFEDACDNNWNATAR